MNKILLTPDEAARLIILNVADYQENQQERKPERNINVSRFILSDRALRTLCFRVRLSNEFLTLLSAELNDMGWFMISVGNGRHIFLRIVATKNWPRIGAVSRYSDARYKKLQKDTLYSLQKNDLKSLETTMSKVNHEIKHLVDDNFDWNDEY